MGLIRSIGMFVVILVVLLTPALWPFWLALAVVLIGVALRKYWAPEVPVD
jgi:hypothetical protein